MRQVVFVVAPQHHGIIDDRPLGIEPSHDVGRILLKRLEIHGDRRFRRRYGRCFRLRRRRRFRRGRDCSDCGGRGGLVAHARVPVSAERPYQKKARDQKHADQRGVDQKQEPFELFSSDPDGHPPSPPPHIFISVPAPPCAVNEKTGEKAFEKCCHPPNMGIK